MRGRVLLLLVLAACSRDAATPERSPIPTTRYVAESAGEDAGVRFTVTIVHCGFDGQVIRDAERVSARGMFCYANLDLVNGSDAPVRLEPSCQTLLVRDVRYTGDARASRVANGPGVIDRDIAAGSSARLSVYFDVPVNAKPTAVELHANCESSGATVGLRFEGID